MISPGITTVPLWEILVPTISNEGKPFRTRFHKVWDAKVRKITGGLTILKPVKGNWISPAGELFTERMIPVRIKCTYTQIQAIAKMTAKYYSQMAVMYYMVSDFVVIEHFPV